MLLGVLFKCLLLLGSATALNIKQSAKINTNTDPAVIRDYSQFKALAPIAVSLDEMTNGKHYYSF